MTLWNFLKYNVAGGGDSSLYGVESGAFYLRNALTNLNLVAPLALLVPLSALFLMSQKRGERLTPHPSLRALLAASVCSQPQASGAGSQTSYQYDTSSQYHVLSRRQHPFVWCQRASTDASACRAKGWTATRVMPVLALEHFKACSVQVGGAVPCGWLYELTGVQCIAGSGVRIRLAIAVAPVWVWVAVISALPHKEERFLFPVYTLVSPKLSL